jgi:signal transduction histidine kinase
MTTESQLEYRVIYDSLSHFSIELNKANSLSDIQQILQSNLKGLFNFCVCRITYFQQNNFVCYSITSETPAVVTGTHQLLWDVEKLMFYEGLPLRLNRTEHAAILNNVPCQTSVDKLWGWKLNYTDEAGILLTILADNEKPFLRKHIPLVKMISEMLFTKMRLILLLQTVQKSEAELMLTNKQLEASHATISKLVNTQEKIIEERTQELTQLNKQLIDIIHFNSHTIREPLTRIMGLMQLKPIVPEDEFFSSCWPMMMSSVQDLDGRLKEVILKTEKI